VLGQFGRVLVQVVGIELFQSLGRRLMQADAPRSADLLVQRFDERTRVCWERKP
jgi:hypothetical protein